MALSQMEPFQGETLLQQTPPLIEDPVETAHIAGLRYYSDAKPGIARKRAGKHFSYIARDGQPVHDPEVVDRIKALAIPPAWTKVWICPVPNGHLQATGYDARRRKQYRYHPRWREVRDETKYFRMILFGETVPKIRERTNHDLSLHSLSREKVLATVVQLLDATAIRVGNEEYARDNASYGLTTLHTDHMDVEGSTVHFHFRGKGGKEHVVDVHHPRLARALKRFEDLPGYELFQYCDEDGELRGIDSGDVNDYLREITEQHFTAKDFRTWHGTLRSACALHEVGGFKSEAQAKRNINRAIEAAAEHLGNTVAICRKSYVHPRIIEAYMDGSLQGIWEEAIEKARVSPIKGLAPEEVALLVVLTRQLDADEIKQAEAS